MQPLIRRECKGRTAFLAHSTRADGNLSPSTVPADALAARRAQAVPIPWCDVRQVHSDRAVVVDRSAVGGPSPIADALVTTTADLLVAVHSGDCVPVGFITESAAVGVAHAGWKGLEAGVLESTVRRLREFSGAGEIIAAVGPHIRASQYEFGTSDLARLVTRFGPDTAAQTSLGAPALDLTAAIANELGRLDVQAAVWSPDCTATMADTYWSHRARQESGRIALVGWIEDSVGQSDAA